MKTRGRNPDYGVTGLDCFASENRIQGHNSKAGPCQIKATDHLSKLGKLPAWNLDASSFCTLPKADSYQLLAFGISCFHG